jgi:hypothetical protein
MATRTYKEPFDSFPVLLEHVVETVLITTYRANAYLIHELVFVNLFLHYAAMSVRIINSFHLSERLLATEGFTETD